jgi:hypothetical protein
MYTVKPVLATISPPGLNPPTHFYTNNLQIETSSNFWRSQGWSLYTGFTVLLLWPDSKEKRALLQMDPASGGELLEI